MKEYFGDVVRLKFQFNINSGDALVKEQYVEVGSYPFIGANGVLGHYVSAYIEDEVLVVGRVGSVGAVNRFSHCWVNDNALVMSTQKPHDLAFAYYALQCIDFLSYSAGTAMPLITGTQLKNTRVPNQTAEVKEHIVTYLDRRTAKIDSLLADLAHQAEMLDCYKRELIAEAVTKGLDKSAAMKDCGVDWIGEMPEHWDVTKTKWMFEIVKRIYGKEDRDVLSITQRGLKVRDLESNDGQLAESYANYQVVNVNDFAMNSMDLLTGWVDCSPFEGVTSPDYRVFRFLPGKEQCHSYYKYLFQMCYKNRIFYRLGQGISNLGRWRLQADQFLNMRLPQPPVDEQESIAAYLDEKTAKIEGLIADIMAQIEKLKQYRQIVIHDAVTGKVKVTEG